MYAPGNVCHCQGSCPLVGKTRALEPLGEHQDGGSSIWLVHSDPSEVIPSRDTVCIGVTEIRLLHPSPVH